MTLNLAVAEPLQFLTTIPPDFFAPVGTFVVIFVLLALKEAFLPPMVTLVTLLLPEKLAPLMVTLVPAFPLDGETFEIFGFFAYWLHALWIAAACEC